MIAILNWQFANLDWRSLLGTGEIGLWREQALRSQFFYNRPELQCRSRVKVIGVGAHDERRRHELLGVSRGMLPRDIFKYEVFEIAFLSF